VKISQTILGLGAVLCLALFGVAAASGANSKDSGPNSKKYPFGYPVIDAHCHLDFGDNTDVPKTVTNTKEGYLKSGKEIGLIGFVAHTHDDVVATPDMSPLQQVFCAGIRDKFDVSRVEKGIQNKKYKCIKIYLGYVYRYAYDEAYEPLYDLAAKYNVPVVFHTGDTETSDGLLKYSHPLTLDEVAVKHRKVTFVMAHLGNPWINTAAEVMYKNPNMYGDVSALMIGDLKRSPVEDIKKLIIEPVAFATSYIENADKLMFGTDWPLVSQKQYLEATLKAIAPKDRAKFLYQNAAKVFKFDVDAKK
jgi:uncharacterized protein